jgi:predicted outer membrane repeat protein
MNSSLNSNARVAVIAGVGSGLGASLARRFVEEDCKVALLARSTEYLEQLAKEINDEHGAGSALAVPCDLANPDQISGAFKLVREKLGPTDLLVNHASGGGGPRGGSLLELDLNDFERAWRVGVFGALLCAREAAADMLASGRNSGTILFTGATSSVRGGAIAFSSAKFGSRGLAQSLARELWPRGIHVAHIVLDGGFADLSLGPAGSDELDPDAMATVLLAASLPGAQRVDLRTRPSRLSGKILRVASTSRVKRRSVFTPSSPTQPPNHPAGINVLAAHFHAAAGAASRPLPRHP